MFSLNQMGRLGSYLEKPIGLLLCLVSIFCHAQVPIGSDVAARWIAEIDQVIQQQLDSGSAPGASVVLVVDGRIAHVRGFGRANDLGAPVSPATIFSIGSVTKTYVGFAIDQLARQGLLSLDDPASRYLPELAMSEAREVTIRHLLNHTSGFSTYVGNRNQTEVEIDPRLLAESVMGLGDLRLTGKPGARHEYSNANYQLLGVVIERVTLQSFPEAMQGLVFAPLGLAETRISHDFDAADSSAGYRFWLSSPVSYNQPLGSALEPQGGISSNAMDVGRYLIALTGGAPGIDNIWNADWAHASPAGKQGLGYGLAWYIQETDDDIVVYHQGLNPGFSAAIAFSPSRRVGIGIMANASDGFVAGDVSALLDAPIAVVFPTLEATAADFGAAKVQLSVLVLLCLAIAIWAVAVIKQYFAGGLKKRGWFWTIAPSALLGCLAYLVGVVLPPALGITLGGIWMFSPDIGLVLQALTWLAAGWAMLRVLIILTAVATGR